MKQIVLKSNSLWQPGLTPKKTSEYFMSILKKGDKIRLEYVGKPARTELVNFFVNDVDFSENISKALNNKNKDIKDISFGAIRDKISIGLVLGFFTCQKEYKHKSNWMNRNGEEIEFEYQGYSENRVISLFDDWVNDVDFETSLVVKKMRDRLFATIIFHNKIKSDFASVDKAFDKATGLSINMMKVFFGNDGKNGKDPNRLKIYSSISEKIDKYISEEIVNVDISFDNSEAMYRKLSKTIEKRILYILNIKHSDMPADAISFDYEPVKIDKKINGIKDGVLRVIKNKEKYSLMLNNVLIIKEKGFKTLSWNLWGLVLNGNIEVPDHFLTDNYNKKLIDNLDEFIIFRNNKYNFVKYISINNIKKLGKGTGYFSDITKKYLLTGVKTLINNKKKIFPEILALEEEIGYNRTIGAKKYITGLLSGGAQTQTKKTIEKKEITEIDAKVLSYRSIFSKSVGKYLVEMRKMISEYTSIEGVKYPYVEKAHIYEVNVARDEGDLLSIKDENNSLLLPPNIHSLWDKNFIILTPEGIFLTRDDRETIYVVKKELLTPERNEYIRIRYELDITMKEKSLPDNSVVLLPQ